MEPVSSHFVPSARVMGLGVLAQVPALLQHYMPGDNYLMVCDDTTYVACGQKLYLDLLQTVKVKPYSIGTKPKALLSHAEDIISELAQMDGVIAVGSGTVNDVTKYAATQANKPYICVATAASMNGYTSATASLEHNKFKHSYPCKVARAVVADLSVITAAPRRLSRAGLGDTLCRTSVETDMLMAHFLLGTPYPKEVFDLFRGHESKLISEEAKFKAGEPSYFEMLMTALFDSGDWMANMGSSAIASQSEHMVIHTAELMYGDDIRLNTHGELIALATISCAGVQQKMMVTQPTLKYVPANEAMFNRQFGKQAGPDLHQLYMKKGLTAEKVAQLNARLSECWAELKQAIAAIQQPVGVLERLYMQLNLPTKPSDLRLDGDRYQSALTYAHFTRDRFTFLDLMAMSGRRF